MTSPDEYVDSVRRGMIGMSPAVRDDIVRELKGHIADSTAASGGNVRASLVALGSPREVGRRYRDLYGYGTAFKALFATIAFLLAVPSVPVLLAGPETLFPLALSLVFVIGAAAWIIWVSVAAGSRAGILAGIAGLAGRLVGFAFATATQTGGMTSPVGLGLLLTISVMFVLLGWIPGTAKKAWSAPRSEL